MTVVVPSEGALNVIRGKNLTKEERARLRAEYQGEQDHGAPSTIPIILDAIDEMEARHAEEVAGLVRERDEALDALSRVPSLYALRARVEVLTVALRRTRDGLVFMRSDHFKPAEDQFTSIMEQAARALATAPDLDEEILEELERSEPVAADARGRGEEVAS